MPSGGVVFAAGVEPMWESASSAAATKVPRLIGKAVALRRASAWYEAIYKFFPPAPIWAGDSLALSVKAVLGGKAVECARASCRGFFRDLLWWVWVDHAAGRRRGQHRRVAPDWGDLHCRCAYRLVDACKLQRSVCGVGGAHMFVVVLRIFC